MEDAGGVKFVLRMAGPHLPGRQTAGYLLNSMQMDPEREERIYPNVLQSVLWGTPREEVFQMLASNGFAGQDAERVYERARKARTVMLRGDGVRKTIKGALLLGVGIGIFCGFWYGLEFINRTVWVVSCAAGAWGSLMFLNGIMDIVLAPTKTGPIHSDV